MNKRPQDLLADPPPEGDEARGSRLPCGSLDGAESERHASREVDEKTWGGPAFSHEGVNNSAVCSASAAASTA